MIDNPLMTSKTAEHYTPPEIACAVIRVLGAIDLDPCADPGRNITARQHYTANENGLARPWVGRIYINPPYGRQIKQWAAKFRAEHLAQNMHEGIALVPARVDTQWFAILDVYPVCFVRGRIKFWQQNGAGLIEQAHAAPFPSAICYAGPNPGRFAEVFRRYGPIWHKEKDRS